MSAKGLLVFVVEDEPMIRMLVVDMLEELGCRVAAEAGDVEEAAKLAQSTDFDLAILDVNLKGKLITPVAELIKAPQSFSPPAMARKACRRIFETSRHCRSPSSWKRWPRRSTRCLGRAILKRGDIPTDLSSDQRANLTQVVPKAPETIAGGFGPEQAFPTRIDPILTTLLAIEQRSC